MSSKGVASLLVQKLAATAKQFILWYSNLAITNGVVIDDRGETYGVRSDSHGGGLLYWRVRVCDAEWAKTKASCIHLHSTRMLHSRYEILEQRLKLADIGPVDEFF